ncbi:hypothetical protein [Micromonospora fluostatini]|uniref:hypothetical protein n=1 Tax=Micromonospora sp. JCM 30529 TaxID=3421643 RepID=UPI003D1813F2
MDRNRDEIQALALPPRLRPATTAGEDRNTSYARITAQHHATAPGHHGGRGSQRRAKSSRAPAPVLRPITTAGVNGHLDVPTGGQFFSPLAAMVSPHRWPRNLPGGWAE